MSVSELVVELRRRGVKLAPEGTSLQVEAPDGALTDDLRAALVEHKQELLAYLNRYRAITSRVHKALRIAEAKSPGRFDWSKDTPETGVAGADLDEAMAGYVEGTRAIDDVQSAWRRYMQALDAQHSTASKQQRQLSLI
jgi:hypothetical protein